VTREGPHERHPAGPLPDGPPGATPPAPPVAAAVLLAAGESRRMQGPNKLLMRVDGEPLVARTARVLREAGVSPVVAVLGHASAQVGAALAGVEGVACVALPDASLGQQASVLAGLRAIDVDTGPLLVVLSDLALLEPADVSALVRAWRERAQGAMLVPWHDGRRGNPVVIDAALRRRVLAEADERGLRGFVDDHRELARRWEAPNDHFVFDLDTADDVAALRARLGGRPVESAPLSSSTPPGGSPA
jgi:CTP:molybdopterin cytidylyltransferase MocA